MAMRKLALPRFVGDFRTRFDLVNHEEDRTSIAGQQGSSDGAHHLMQHVIREIQGS